VGGRGVDAVTVSSTAGGRGRGRRRGRGTPCRSWGAASHTACGGARRCRQAWRWAPSDAPHSRRCWHHGAKGWWGQGTHRLVVILLEASILLGTSPIFVHPGRRPAARRASWGSARGCSSMGQRRRSGSMLRRRRCSPAWRASGLGVPWAGWWLSCSERRMGSHAWCAPSLPAAGAACSPCQRPKRAAASYNVLLRLLIALRWPHLFALQANYLLCEL
jgi:hypothetical protein